MVASSRRVVLLTAIVLQGAGGASWAGARQKILKTISAHEAEDTLKVGQKVRIDYGVYDGQRRGNTMRANHVTGKINAIGENYIALRYRKAMNEDEKRVFHSDKSSKMFTEHYVIDNHYFMGRLNAIDRVHVLAPDVRKKR
jgi:hypothetical protein